MSTIPEHVIRAIRDAVDLADLVGRHVALRRSGTSWKGCCPFHQEKTPSFHVTPERGMWKCFGCGKGGDAFAFLMEREGLAFPEAVRRLATEVGVSIPEDSDPAAVERASRLERLREVVERACVFFEKALRTPAGKTAREYLERRGISNESIVRFRLGYAPPGWRNLLGAAHKAGVNETDLVDAGLVRRKEPEDGHQARVFDMFHERVIFPIADVQGRVLAFGARTLGDEDPKYLNSPETPLFTKGKNVFALHLAKQEMMRTGEGAVMEGYTDVIMAHQHGWPVAVAGLGTALTQEQAVMIARYVKRLYLVYDGDEAGKTAAERNATILLPEEIETRVAVLPEGEDPCDMLRRAGLPALKACVGASREAFDHVLEALATRHDLSTVPGTARALDEALEALLPVRSEVRCSLYVTRVADKFHVAEHVVRSRFLEMRRR